MRPISPHTSALIQQLNEPAGFWEKLKGSRHAAAILSEIGEANEPAAIVDVLPFVLSTKNDIAAAAAASVHKLVMMTSAKDLAWLEGARRRLSPYSGPRAYEWHKLSPEQLGFVEHFGAASVSLLGMASFHQSGYLREAAVKRLDLITSGAELPFLLLRVNDWVSNVRAAAYEAIRSRLRPEYGHRFIANLALVLRLEAAERADHKTLIEAVNELLRSEECRTALSESLKSDDRFIRRASFKLALNSTRPDLHQVVKQALTDQDTVIRLGAALKIPSTLEAAMLDRFVEVMKRDRFMPVRREALRIEVRRSSPGLLAELKSALLDQNPSMREEARYHLRHFGSMDAAAFYRQSLLAGAGRSLFASLSGLGETGVAADDLLILPYTSHGTSKIRTAAIKALAKLNGGAHIDVFITALKDQVPLVSRQGLKALARKTSSISGEVVWDIFQSARYPQVKRNALSLLERQSKWDSIYYLLRALHESDPDSASMSRFAIQRWLARFNRSFSSPRPEQLANLSNVIDECGGALDDKTQAALRFSIRV